MENFGATAFHSSAKVNSFIFKILEQLMEQNTPSVFLQRDIVIHHYIANSSSLSTFYHRLGGELCFQWVISIDLQDYDLV